MPLAEFPKILENVRQEKHVSAQIKVVVVSKALAPEHLPDLLGMLVILI